MSDPVLVESRAHGQWGFKSLWNFKSCRISFITSARGGSRFTMNHPRYRAVWMERFELPTPCSQSRCPDQTGRHPDYLIVLLYFGVSTSLCVNLLCIQPRYWLRVKPSFCLPGLFLFPGLHDQPAQHQPSHIQMSDSLTLTASSAIRHPLSSLFLGGA